MQDESRIDWLKITEQISGEHSGDARENDAVYGTNQKGIHPDEQHEIVRYRLARALDTIPVVKADDAYDIDTLWSRHEACMGAAEDSASATRGQMNSVWTKKAGWEKAGTAVRLGFSIALGVMAVLIAVPGVREALWKDPAGTPTVYMTTAGQQRVVTLPDSSTILLNAQSKLVVDANFGINNRLVELSGEALFTVTDNSGTPFTVTSGELVTSVLGTEFAVRNYPGDPSTSVAVRSGRVSVQTSRHAAVASSTVLIPTQQVEYTSKGDFAVAAALPTKFAFAEQQLVFDGTLLQDAIPEIYRWYGIRLDVKDTALLRTPLRVTLTGHDTSRAIEILSLILNSDAISVNDTLVTITTKMSR